MLKLKNLSFRYPSSDQPVLNGINLSIQAGECIGLLGTNGAGKTTLLSIVSSLLQPSSGSIEWQGPRSIGLVPQQLAFYSRLTVQENLNLFADLYQLRGNFRQQQMDSVLQTTDLQPLLKNYAGTLSGGQQRRLNFAIGILQPAQLYLLDEVTVGVDSHNRHRLLACIQNLRDSGKSIIYTSHYLHEIEAIAPRIVLLDRGHIQCDLDTRSSLKQPQQLKLLWSEKVPSNLANFCNGLGLQSEYTNNSVFIAKITEQQFLTLYQFIVETAQLPCSIQYGQPSLEQFYLKMTGGAL
ncbi:MAG: ABC transporter ATP-binding protein [Pseudomonas sp.]|nr:ABC transporter ATP-binding protein [Pseudomonas sp.]